MGYKVLVISNESVLIREIERLFLSTDDFLFLGVVDSPSTNDVIIDFAPDTILYDTRENIETSIDRITDFKVDRISAELPVIAIVDSSETDRILALFYAGADDFIVYPFPKNELIQRVKIGIQQGFIFEKQKKQATQFGEVSLAANSAGNSIMIIDDTGTIVWVNGGFERLYECKLNEFTAIFGENIYDTSVNRTTYEAMKRCRETGDYVVYDNEWQTPSG